MGPGTCMVLVSIWRGQGTHPDESEAFDSHARSSQIWYENALKTPSQVWGGMDFRQLFYLLQNWVNDLFTIFFRTSVFLSLIMLVAVHKNGVTRHSGSEFLFISKRTHGGSTSSLHRTFRSVSADLSLSTKKKWGATVLHGHSVLHDRFLNEKEKEASCTLPMKFFDVIVVCDSSRVSLPLFYSSRVLHEWHWSDSYSSRFACSLNLPIILFRPNQTGDWAETVKSQGNPALYKNYPLTSNSRL